MSKNYNSEIVEKIGNFLTEDGWNYNFNEDKGFFQFGINLSGRIKNIQYAVNVNESDYTVYTISPISADQEDAEQIHKMAEFVCRANYGLKNGNFELDVRDGELRYKCYVDCNGIVPTTDMVRSSILCPAAMFTRYSRGIVQILFGDMSAADAIALCEEPRQEPESNGMAEEEDASDRLLSLLRSIQESGEDSDDISAVSGE